MNEAGLQRLIQGMARSLGAYCVKYHGDQYGTAGTPDLLLCVKGRFVAFEVKLSPEVPTALQTQRMREIYSAGGVAFGCTKVEDAKRIIESINYDHAQSWQLVRNASLQEIESLEELHHGD